MTPSQISQFLQDCIIFDEARGSGLDGDVLYGLYVSWCSLNRKVPLPDHAFRTALRLAGLRPEKNRKSRRFPGLRMTKGAATILKSNP